MPALERLGLQNFDQAVASIGRLGIECDLELNGDINIALEPHEDGWLAEEAEQLRSLGHDVVLFDAEAMRAEVASSTYRTGMWQQSGSAVVDPARLCWGLRRAALDAGVRIFERTPVTAIGDRAAGLELAVGDGALRCRHALLATSAFPALVRSVRRRVVPVYDYVLVTEPLGAERMSSIGWQRRQGLGDCANQFHYYRLTADDRILWGGYDAIYHYGNRMGERAASATTSASPASPSTSSPTFPQLEGVRFTHRWAGAIDTCSRFFAFYGTSHGGRVAHAVGHTGPGCRRQPLRRAGRPRPAGRARDGGDTPASDPQPPAALPARAPSLGGDRADPKPPRRRRPPRRPAGPVAANARPARTGLRQLSRGRAGVRPLQRLGSDPYHCSLGSDPYYESVPSVRSVYAFRNTPPGSSRILTAWKSAQCG